MYHLACIQSASLQSTTNQLQPKSSFKWLRLTVLCIVVVVSFLFGTMMNTFAGTEFAEPNSLESSQYHKGGNVSSHVDVSEPVTYIYVEKGDTLWGIAQQYAPQHEDPRKYIHRLKQHNQLETSMLQIGQKIEIIP